MPKRPRTQSDDDPRAGLIPGCDFLPRWWDADLELQFGPSLSSYQQQCREFNQSRAGGGLFDEATHRACGGGRMVTDKSGLGRYDADDMADFMADHSQDLSARFVQAYVLFFVNRMTYRDTAESMKTSPQNVRKLVNRLRRKMREAE